MNILIIIYYIILYYKYSYLIHNFPPLNSALDKNINGDCRNMVHNYININNNIEKKKNILSSVMNSASYYIVNSVQNF